MITFANYFIHIGEKHGRDWYDWCLFASGDPAIVKTIFCVEYTLHPTFVNPVRTVSQKASRFALYSSGWGVFRIAISVTMEDGSKFDTSHDLNFSDAAWPIGRNLTKFSDDECERVYRALHNMKFRWRTLSNVIAESEVDRLRTIDILEDFETKRVVRKAPVRSMSNEEMFGATDIVGLTPTLDS